MNSVLTLYNKWINQTLVTDKLFDLKNKETKNTSSHQWPNSELWQQWREAKRLKDELEYKLYGLLADKIFPLPSGNYLVPCYDDCMDYQVKVMEVLRTSE